MKICLHIAYYFKENRLKYLDNMLKEYNKFPGTVDVFIHTNVSFSQEIWKLYDNGKISVIVHDFSNDNPMFLTWKCREMIPEQLDSYDIFMYSEDDILVPRKAFEYWLTNKDIVIAENYNLGFCRIQVDDSVEDEYICDPQENMLDRNIVTICEKKFLVNKFSYCAFWIYDKVELKKYMKTSWFHLDTMKRQHSFELNTIGIREVSAWGLHTKHPYYNLGINHYKDTIILLDENEKLHQDCRVYHLDPAYKHGPNSNFCKAKFNDCIRR